MSHWSPLWHSSFIALIFVLKPGMLPGVGVLGNGPFALWERSERSRYDVTLKLELLIPPDENFQVFC
jgi:hypothetical protein